METEDQLKVEKPEDITNFKWDDDDSDEEDTFFQDKEEKEKTETEEKPEEKTETETEEEKEERIKVEKEKKKEEEDFSFKEEKKEEEEKRKLIDEETEVNTFTTLANELKERGVMEFELEEDEEINQEKFFELHEKQIATGVDEALQSFYEELDDDAISFLKFKKAGGRTSDFFNVAEKSFDENSIESLKEEKDQEKIVSHYMRTIEGADQDEIHDRIEWLKDGGKLEKHAETYYKKITALKKARESSLQQEVETENQNNINRAKKREKLLTETLENSKLLEQFSLNKKGKKELFEYVNIPTVKIGNKKVPGFYHDLNEIYKDPEKLLMLSQLLKTDFDFSVIKTKLRTEGTKKERSALLEINKKGIKSTKVKTSDEKYLSDYF